MLYFFIIRFPFSILPFSHNRALSDKVSKIQEEEEDLVKGPRGTQWWYNGIKT